MKGSRGRERSDNLTINSRALCQLSYPGMELPQTLASKVSVNPATGCWEWTAARQTNGYGSVGVPGEKRTALAHRYVYELLVGPIADGLQIDHLCRVKHCVNPEHLEPVTHAVNQRRAFDARGPKPTCKHGHETNYDGARDTQGFCRVCKNERRRKQAA